MPRGGLDAWFVISSGVVSFRPDCGTRSMTRGRDLVKRLAGEEVADPVDIPVAGRAPTDAGGAE